MTDLLELSINAESFRVANRECEYREFKLAFDNESIWKYAKTMASFANHNGGVIFFGVNWLLCGFGGNPAMESLELVLEEITHVRIGKISNMKRTNQ